MKIRTADLTGAALDLAVAYAEDLEDVTFSVAKPRYCIFEYKRWEPSTNWAQGGPILEQQKNITLDYFPDGGHPYGGEWLVAIWDANGSLAKEEMGETILIAAMRCYVASKLGDEVEVPDGLL